MLDPLDIKPKVNRASMVLFLESMLGADYEDDEKETYARYLNE